MRYSALLSVLLCFLLCCVPVFAQVAQEQRRVDQEARQGLFPTVSQPSPLQLTPAQRVSLHQHDSVAEVDYFQDLLSRKYVRRSDVLQAMLLLIGEDPCPLGQAEQIDVLVSKKVIPPQFKDGFSGEALLQRGLSAYMICRALNLKGGLVARLVGLRQRYALNELVFLGIMPGGSIDDRMTSQEFISSFINAAEFNTAHRR